MFVLKIAVDSTMSPDIIEYYKNLQSITSTDSGIDIIVPIDTSIKYNKIYNEINHLIKCQLVKSKDGVETSYPYYLYPRSSFSKYPIIMANHTGIIDADYRGHIKTRLRYHKYNELEEFKVNKGMKLFQICSPDLSPMKVLIVNEDELTSTSRGEGGFGSTGFIL